MDKEIYDVVIVGGGPAGLSAGVYTARQRLKTLLITKSFGGQMARKAVDIENYLGFEKISGSELIKKFEKHLKQRKVDIEMDSVVKVKQSGKGFSILTAAKKQFQAKAVIVASGADPRPLEVPGEKEYIGRGISYCVACDGPLYSDKDIAVIGGGNAGFEAAISLINFAKKIYILEHGSVIKADEENQAKVKKTGKITVITSAAVKKVEGGKFVESIVYQDRPSKKLNTLKVQGVFVEIGSQPATSFIKGLVEFNEKDEIVVNPKTGHTSTAGIFVAGDADDVPYKQIIIAAGEGAKAALSVANYLEKTK